MSRRPVGAGSEPVKLLSIETGIRCNSRCAFCYQRDYRRSGAAPADPTTDDLREKLALGRRDGYEGVGFSGGEPTARADFPELVHHARALGYRRVALTTNGRRLADRGYRRALLAAGVDAIGWSAHGACAGTHDALTRVPGSFELLVRGLRGTLADAAAAGRRLDVNIFSLVTRANAAELPALCRRFFALGVRLFIFQPLVFSRGNLSALAALALPLDEVIAAVRAALRTTRALGARAKTFNLPPCLFPAGAVEGERHAVRVCRVHERGRPGEARLPTASGFFRLASCASCSLRRSCPGVHASLLPQAAIRAEVRAGLARSGRPRERWLGGLELADAETLADAARAARRAGARRVVLCDGGDSVLGAELPDAAVVAGIEEIRFVVHRREPRSGDGRRATRGNLAEIAQRLERFRVTPAARRIVRSVGMLLERSEAAAQASELRDLVDAGAQGVHLEGATGDPELPVRLADAMRLVMGRWRRHGWARAARLRLDLAAGPELVPAWQRWAARGLWEVRDVRGRFLHTRLTGPRFGWITDSVPAVVMPADFHHPERWPADVVSPLVLDAALGPPARSI